ncbi:hypothetical protein QBC37DRAFT_137572 [Rhypophila decipiens]|uniref:SH3 domain-containing protein n=1 Tax=Rhypophila decipiens TaxID=261697 RepID=A0AAN7BFK5_9PEZI|nr:hypothetical protein QBC37DRAFT_137572 [Rhypophila decipiens]
MGLTPPPPPTRFPCWVRAVYSWGGESKRDLGFIEGDLIECLNAGDGSWWVGRLWRDRRAVGAFPSNFVEVLPETFRPTSRSTSPLTNSNTPSPKNTPQKSKTFRKPFEAYAKAPHYTTAKIPETYKDGAVRSPLRSRETSSNSMQSAGAATARARRDASPSQPQPLNYGTRAQSPAPFATPSRQPSNAPYRTPSPAPAAYRGPSPAPYHALSPSHRAPSPAPFHALSPASHRPASPAPYHALSPSQRAPSPAPYQALSSAHRAPSPAPYRPPSAAPHRAPSPGPFGAPLNSFRAPSPAPSYKPYRPPSAQPYQMDDGPDSPPPPPPPPHRHVAARNESNASYDDRFQGQIRGDMSRHNSNASYNHHAAGYHTPRMPSPCPPSPGGIEGLTPSPLREAMDDVMEQLDALGRETQSPSPPSPPLDPWSPDSFQEVHQRSRKKRIDHSRPQTAMGIGNHIDEGYDSYSGSGGSSRDPTHHAAYSEKKPPELSNYVERMETRLRNMHQHSASMDDMDTGPPPPPKGQLYERPRTAMSHSQSQPEHKLRHKKSAYEMGKEALNRTFTTKTNSTSASSGVQSTTSQSTNRSLMSGVSAGGISATSAGSLARKNRNRAQSALGMRDADLDRPGTPFSGVTYHSSHASGEQRSKSQLGFHDDAIGGLGLGGLVQPKAKKQNFIKRILESAKTGVASTRGSIATAGAGSIQGSSIARSTPTALTSLSSAPIITKTGRDSAREMGLSSGVDWVQVRRDVNRSNSLSGNERNERRDRCQMLDYPVLDPVDELFNSIDGDESGDCMPVEEPTNYMAINFSQVDKNSRFITNLPPNMTAITLATTYVCRPYRSDAQRLRAIFTWVAERICWEEDFEGEIDTRRVIQTKRACAEEYAVLVMEMCRAVGLPCEMVRGYLKAPGETPDSGIMPRSNHWWNAVLVDNEWRMIDCCLASPSNPKRSAYSSCSSSSADSWWFLTRPTEICWTHIPEHHQQQHICPPVAHEILLNLPCACPPYFKNGLHMVDYNTSLIRIEDLEMVHVKFNVPADVEVAAEVEVRAFSRDSDGDFFESGDMVKKRALAQAEWFGGIKRYTVKALLPGDEGTGTLKVYAGKRGLMHSIKDIPHPLAFALPIIHTGENPPYEFVTRHPTPHAQRHDIYVVQPQCQRLALNNTFVFVIRQHPSSVEGSPMTPSSNPGLASPIPFVRPSSAMSMTSSSAAGSNPSTSSSGSGSKKPAKLAIQTPGGKILRLMRKEERRGLGGSRGHIHDEDGSDGGTWETIIKCSETGIWRGLVLADRTARWCVFAEWVCQG